MYELLWTNKSHLFAATVNSLCYSRYTADYNYTDAFLMVYENGMLSAYLKKDILIERSERAQTLINQETTFSLYLAECEAIKNLYKIFYNTLLQEDFSKKTSAELALVFRSLLHLQARCVSLYQGTNEYATKNFEDYLTAEIKQHVPDWAVSLQAVAVATSPEIEEEEKAFDKLRNEQNPDLLGFIKAYPWVCAKAFFFDEAIAELSQLINVRSAKKSLDQPEPTQDIQELLRNPKLARVANILERLGLLRIELKFLLSTKLLGSPLYAEIANRLDVPTNKLFFTFDADEILTGLTNGKIISQVGPRVYRGKGNNYEVLYGEAAEDYLGQLRKDVTPIELSGLSVSRGVVRGKVRVIIPTRMSELVKESLLQEGDILVTTMTNPNMAFLMSRASGIVTDEGGITCHAAIISRELKKPCIVGTRYATTTLKDGDYVEVDANTGVVKILQKA